MNLAQFGGLTVIAASFAIGITAQASAHTGITDAIHPAENLSEVLEPGAGHKLLEHAEFDAVKLIRTAASRTTKRRSRTLAPRRTTKRRPPLQHLTTGNGQLSHQPTQQTGTQANDTSPLKPFREDGIKFYHPWGNDID